MLEKTLESFEALKESDCKWELIVVDNASTDHTSRVVRSFENKLPLVSLYERKQGKNHANNLAIERARGEIYVFCDDDILPVRGWLNEIANACERWPRHMFFGGRVTPEFPPSSYHFIRTSAYSAYVYAIHDLGILEGEYPPTSTPVGPNCWVRSSIFRDGLRYDNNIGPKGRGRISGSELEFFTRLTELGHKPIYVPSAHVQHRIQSYQTQLKYLLRRSFASGRGQARIFGFPDDCRRILGIPRYLFREIAETGASGFGALLAGSPKRAFEHVMKCSVLMGAMVESRRAKSCTEVGN